MSEKHLPQSLTARQELQRQETINKVMHALEYIDSIGMKCTVKTLCELTGLSRSVFAKPHIRQLVDSHRFGKDEPTEAEKKAVKKKQKHDSDIRKLKERISALTAENAELRHQNGLLRGQNYLLLKKKEDREMR